MCGIAGIINLKNNQINKKSFDLDKLKNIMRPRGPDNQSSYEHKGDFFKLNFFFSRLSIIDLNKRSNQPFFFDNLIIVFNGEIYKYLEKNLYIFFMIITHLFLDLKLAMSNI